MSLGLVGAIIVGVSLIVGAVSTIIIKKKDNIVEQVAEKIIKAETGLDIDFTPEEQEKLKQEERDYKASKIEEE